MIPAAFEYERAESVDDAVKLLGQSGGDAKLIAGGHSLLPLMRLRLSTPSLLIDIDRISDLSYVREATGHALIGARQWAAGLGGASTARSSRTSADRSAARRLAPRVIGVRSRGDPASDPPAASGSGRRDRSLGRRTDDPGRRVLCVVVQGALQPNEVLTAIRVPKLARDGLVVSEVPPPGHRLGHRRRRGRCRAAERQHRLRLHAWRSPTWTPRRRARRRVGWPAGAPTRLRWRRGRTRRQGTSPPSDTTGSTEYRTELSKILVRRALEEATAG